MAKIKTGNKNSSPGPAKPDSGEHGSSMVTIGLVEDIIVKGRKSEKKVKARIDTGATKSSIDMKLAAELRLGPLVTVKETRSAHGRSMRPVVRAKVLLAGKEIESSFTVVDRSHMTYRVLVGRDILADNGFLIDPAK